MSNSPQKPLPAIPRRPAHSQPLTTLTVDAQSHLSSFVRHILSETDTAIFTDGGTEPWAQALESGLAELGESISRGGWLTGLKRGRKAQKLRREARQAGSDKEKAKSKKDQEEDGKGKTKKKAAQDETPDRPSSDTQRPLQSPQSPKADPGLALSQIRELVGRPMLPTPKPSAKHMLLTVVPFGSRIPLPRGDSGFDLISTGIGCIFTNEIFSLPDAHAPESVFLYGLDEWDGERPSSAHHVESLHDFQPTRTRRMTMVCG
jgi:1-phosphatidylinositol-3-phosphate 5-kinase